MTPSETDTLLVDTRTAALVDDHGSIHWLCLPRSASAASVAALLTAEEGGSWQLAPGGQVLTTRRRYRGDTPILETEFETAEGSIRIVDFVPQRCETRGVVRLVAGVRGWVRMHMDLRLRFGCGRIRPWLRTTVGTHAEEAGVRADFRIWAGELVPFVLTWHHSQERAGVPVDPFRALADTESFWNERLSSRTAPTV